MIGIGIDILSLSRFAGLASRRGTDKLARRICTPGELAEYAKIPTPISLDDHRAEQAKLSFLSSRWCLKEAAYKALSSHIHPRWTGFEVVRSAHGAPEMRLALAHVRWRDGSTLARRAQDDQNSEGVFRLLCTLSNDAGVVVGVVVAM